MPDPGSDELPSGPLGKRDWETLYQEEAFETLPWYSPLLDSDLDQALSEHEITNGRVFDLGTGPGTQAIELAKRGFNVVASDVSASAVHKAAEMAEQAQVDVHFIADDILQSKIVGPFDLVFDRGCFHVFPPDKRKVYVDHVASILEPGGWLFLKCFSEEEMRDGGPNRFSPDELKAVFEERFEIISIRRTHYQGTFETNPKALFAAMRRR